MSGARTKSRILYAKFLAVAYRKFRNILIFSCCILKIQEYIDFDKAFLTNKRNEKNKLQGFELVSLCFCPLVVVAPSPHPKSCFSVMLPLIKQAKVYTYTAGNGCTVILLEKVGTENSIMLNTLAILVYTEIITFIVITQNLSLIKLNNQSRRSLTKEIKEKHSELKTVF